MFESTFSNIIIKCQKILLDLPESDNCIEMSFKSVQSHCALKLSMWSGFLALSLLVFSCEDEPVERDYPRVRTLEVTNISEAGATFSAEVLYEGNVPITEHGFAWSFIKPDVTNSDRVIFGALDGKGVFSADISTTLFEGLTYKVCGYVKAGDYTVYGEEIKFTSLGSLGPVITGFEPAMAELGDTILVKGRHFSWISNKTFIDDIQTNNYQVSDSVIKIQVPSSLTKRENIISVEVAGNQTSYTAEKLIVILPEIASIMPPQGYWGDTLTLDVLHLSSDLFINVTIGDIAVVPVESFDGSKVRIVVPAALGSTEAIVQIGIPGRKITSPAPFILLPPVIDSISPCYGNWSSIVTLYGQFNPTLAGSSVKFSNLEASIQSLTRDSIKVKVPVALTAASNIVYSYGTFQCTSSQQFSFLPPEIISVSPMSDYAGGIVTITGNNFSPDNTLVWFNELSGKIISVSNNEIKCYVPGGYNGNAEIKVTFGTQEAVYPDPFLMTNPVVTSFYPSEGTIGDTITMECKDYNSSTGFVLSPTMGAGGYTLTRVSAVNNIIKAVISNYNTTSGYFGATVSRNSISSVISNEQLFTIKNSPAINSFSPLSGTDGTEVTITGSNFSALAQYNRVVINGTDATITYSDRNEIRFIVPSLNSSGDYGLTVYVGNIYVISAEKFSYTCPWSKLPNLPFTCYYGFSMKFGNEVIVTNGPSTTTNKSLYRFDPVSGTYSSLNGQTYTFPSVWPSVVVKENTAYLLGLNGQSQFYAFDYGSLTIDKVSDYPGKAYGEQILLDGDSVLYMGGGYTSGIGYTREFWKYSLSSGSWTRLNDLPGYSCHTNEFTVNNRNYVVFNNNSMFEYDPVNDSWISRAQYPGYWCRFKVAVECGGLVYMGYGDYSPETTLKKYDPGTDMWVDLGYTNLPRISYYLNFSIDGKVYIGGGYNNQAMWMYDPEYTP
jgi:N-acetylneuraminic acid mutarotase